MFVVYAMLAYLAVSMLVAWWVLRRGRKRRRPASTLWDAGLEAHFLHRVSLRGRTLRFYRSPRVGPDFPWAVLRDLVDVAATGTTYNVSSEWIYRNNPALAQVLLTEEGPELLLSHWAAKELLTSLTPNPDERSGLLAAFREAMAEAYVLQWAGLSRQEFLRLCDLAGRRSG